MNMETEWLGGQSGSSRTMASWDDGSMKLQDLPWSTERDGNDISTSWVIDTETFAESKSRTEKQTVQNIQSSSILVPKEISS